MKKHVETKRKLVVMDQRLYSSMVAMLEEAQTIIESGTSILRTNRYFKAANRRAFEEGAEDFGRVRRVDGGLRRVRQKTR